jgi:hypothetical protein
MDSQVVYVTILVELEPNWSDPSAAASPPSIPGDGVDSCSEWGKRCQRALSLRALRGACIDRFQFNQLFRYYLARACHADPRASQVS